MTTQKTKLQIIEETVAAYADPSNRATDGLACRYLAPNGNKCAVGRCFRDEADDAFKYGMGAIYLFEEFEMGNILKSEYLGHSVQFWKDIQGLHDHDNNFEEQGYSNEGVKRISLLKQEYANQ